MLNVNVSSKVMKHTRVRVRNKTFVQVIFIRLKTIKKDFFRLNFNVQVYVFKFLNIFLILIFDFNTFTRNKT